MHDEEWMFPDTARKIALDAIQRAHLSMPENADYEMRDSAVRARCPFRNRSLHPWKVWRACAAEYMSKLWPGRPAKPLDAETTPLFFAPPHRLKERTPKHDRC